MALDKEKYNEHFHAMVIEAICCGLQHPIEWVESYSRAIAKPYDELDEIEEFCWQARREVFEMMNPREPKDDKEVTDWFNAYYAKNE